jgi:hypothetical protein
MSLSRFYRLKPKRNLGNLFAVGSGGCTDVHSGIGNVSYVKDILTETVVTTKFNCSKFGPHSHSSLGWVTTKILPSTLMLTHPVVHYTVLLYYLCF